MAIGDNRVFISAVTSEFGNVRSAVSENLRAKGWEVRVQDDFRAERHSDTLLQLLHDYIEGCDKVVCVIGQRSGASPEEKAAARFNFPRVLPADVEKASYTQWEFFFARYYRKPCSIYIAKDDYPQDRPDGIDQPGLQASYLEHIKGQGLHYTSFSTADALRAAVLTEDWETRPAHAPPPPGKPIVLPYPSIGHLFTGRNEFLRQLRASLMRAGGGKAAIFNALYGMGGIGKTRAAVEYAHTHADDYSALLFVEGDTPETLRRNLARLSATLLPGLEATDEGVHVAAVLDWLKVHPGWLLILDNLDNKASLAEAERLMAQCRGGHVIITSRLTNFAAQIEPLELSVLGEDDAAEFLLERTKGRRRVAADDEQQARAIASELGHLALALEQAGAYIAQDRLNLAQYLAQWRTSQDKVMAWSDPAVTHYPRAVAVTWQTSVAQLTPAGRRLLERLAWLAPEPVPEFLLDVPVPGAEDESLRDALADLAAYSLVTRDAEGPYFLVHRLVQDVTRRSLDEAPRTRSLGEALKWIDDAFAGDSRDVRTWPRLEPLASHAQIIIEHADSAQVPEPTSHLMMQIAGLLFAKALHNESERLVRGALKIDEKRVGPDHPDVATDLNNLAQLLQDTNRLAEAEPLMRRALEIDETSLGPDHPNVAIGLNNLAQLLKATDRLAEAEPLMRRALEIDETSFGPDHPNVARDLNNLAQLLQATNRLAEAEPLMRRALDIDETSFGPDHPNVAIRLNNLAGLLQDTNQLAEAEPLMRRALKIDETSFGPDHPEVATHLNNLATLLLDTNRLVEAEPLMRRMVDIFVEFGRKTGHRHPHFEVAVNNYAHLLRAMGQSDAEVEAAIKAVVDDSARHPPPPTPPHPA